MTMMPVLFNDCCVAKSKYTEPVLGPQPEPVPGYFGGTSVTPFDEDTQMETLSVMILQMNRKWSRRVHAFM